ncbi:L-proline dehydrogenase [Alteribacillus bidgolensis]|uniref:proline dehydrogenase n=1 Tax=Alteribacillus bidgolensis TaxID=930129 RepID=A0A1G8N9X7_9BACI|nr:L-proline dehydrogenase [Alteribacillus bidgolensis]
MKNLSRNFFLFLSQNQTLNKSAKRWGWKLGASRVVAGEDINSAMQAVQQLNEDGIMCTVDHLGEFVTDENEALKSAEYCIKTLDAIVSKNVDCNLSLKLTQLGLDIDQKICMYNMENILSAAKKYGIFVRIDMEDFSHYPATIDILKKLRMKYDNTGTVIQAYLHRASADVEALKGIPLRLVKGAYKEPPEVALQKKSDIDNNFIHIIKQHLCNGSYTAIATHDHHIIEKVKKFVQENNIPRDLFEFQMLYGFRVEMHKTLAAEGYRFRTYVPFGKDWYGYFMRRLAERPQNVAFAFKGFFSK